MNWVDIAIFVLVILFAWFGLRFGILIAISSTVSGLVGIAIANLFYTKLVLLFPDKKYSGTLSYLIIFIVVSLGVFFLLGAASKIFDKGFFNSLNKFFGFLVGGLLGIVVCALIIFIIALTPNNGIKKYVDKSPIASYVVKNVIAPIVKPFSEKGYKELTNKVQGNVIKKIKILPD